MLRNNSPLKKRLLLLAQTYIENNGYKYGNLIVNNLIPKLELDSYDISSFVLGDTTHLYSILVFEPILKKSFFISIEGFAFVKSLYWKVPSLYATYKVKVILGSLIGTV